MTVVQQHLDGPRLGGRIELVDRLEDPDRFDQHDVRNPGTARDEGFGRCHLARIVACDESDEDVRVNGAHGAASREP